MSKDETQQGHKPGEGSTVQLAEENRRLVEEVRELKLTERKRGIGIYLAELKDSGKLTPAMESWGIEGILLAAEDSGARVEKHGGGSISLAEAIRGVLDSIPKSTSLIEIGESQGTPTAHLSPEEQRIAMQLGLSAEEFSDIKSQA